jgi:hypothetical protein
MGIKSVDIEGGDDTKRQMKHIEKKNTALKKE